MKMIYKFIFIICFALSILYIYCNFPSVSYSVVKEKKITTEIQKLIEYAYFEGQKDAIDGKIRIERNSDTSWIWIESPWDSGKEPILTNLIDKE